MNKFDVQKHIDDAKFGKFHWLILLVCSMLMIFDGYDLFIFGVVLPKVMVEVIVADGVVETVIDAVVRAARTGRIGDGKIFVSEIEQVVRIRTGETGEAAV